MVNFFHTENGNTSFILKYCINKVPPSAETYLKQKVSDEREKRKIRIELLGQSVNATLFLIGGSLVLLFLLIFLRQVFFM
jgi:hypothetical protein